MSTVNRRDLLRLMGVGGVVFASGLAGAGPAAAAARKKSARDDEDFFFLQLSDTHWGYSGPANPRAEATLPRVVETINATAARPDFVVFTGDLTHTTENGADRRRRLAEFGRIVAPLKVPKVRVIPGEHDAAPDRGAAFGEAFGPTHYTFDHKGVHFIALDNVSDPAGAVGDAQIDWLAADLKKVPRDARVVVLAHRPLFELYLPWDWTTRDGVKVIDALLGHRNVTVFYGHIHQENHHQTEHIAHHAARSLMFPLPAPGGAPKKAPLAWDDAAPWKGLGYRRVEESTTEPRLIELAVEGEAKTYPSGG
jgi:3',5'-cyclic AMP phosphodiesterase CpdA